MANTLFMSTGQTEIMATELGKLMHDFFCIDPDDMNFVEL